MDIKTVRTREEWERRMEKMLRVYAKSEREEKYLRFKNELAEIYKDTKESNIRYIQEAYDEDSLIEYIRGYIYDDLTGGMGMLAPYITKEKDGSIVLNFHDNMKEVLTPYNLPRIYSKKHSSYAFSFYTGNLIGPAKFFSELYRLRFNEGLEEYYIKDLAPYAEAEPIKEAIKNHLIDIEDIYEEYEKDGLLIKPFKTVEYYLLKTGG